MLGSFIGAAFKRETAHKLTTVHLAALYPFMGETGLGARGTYLGVDHAGAAYVLDEWENYSAGTIAGINSIVIGEIGSAKSTLQKLTIWRSCWRGASGPDGRSYTVLDPKCEYGPLVTMMNAAARASGGADVATMIRLEPGGSTRLNPLDTNGGPKAQEALLRAVTSSALERPLTPTEDAALLRALEEFRGEDGVPLRECTLPMIADLLLRPTERMSNSMQLPIDDLRERSRDAAYALGRLIDGDLAGMFDGPTTEGVNMDHQLVVLDLSAVEDSGALGIIMTCAMAWSNASISAEMKGLSQPRKRYLIVDEAWRVLANNLASVEYLAANAKLSRTRGVATRLCFHRLSDMRATADDGSRIQRLSEGLISDSQLKVCFRQDHSEVELTRQILGLTDAEAGLLPSLPRGQALWKLGTRSFLVQMTPVGMEWDIVDTDQRMRRDPTLTTG
jgi:hypothetical protein